TKVKEGRGVSCGQIKVVLGLIFRMVLGGGVEILGLSVSSAKKESYCVGLPAEEIRLDLLEDRARKRKSLTTLE
ncbi:24291_t:CDS:1, partial [Gigaspora rosea]